VALSSGASTGDAWLAVVNPAAGGGRCGRGAAAALDSLRSESKGPGRIETVFTSAPREASALVRDAWTRGVRGFLAVGGAWTFSAFAIAAASRWHSAW
jgi:diacylglycerol kinase family enzyme